MKIIRGYRERRNHERAVEETRLMADEEQSRRDVERYLMEIEEHRSWVVYELRERNRLRLIHEQEMKLLRVNLSRELNDEKDKHKKESGLMSYKGAIISFMRWQNSPAKNLDMEGHGNAILSCKISKCKRFIFSCSADKTAKLWQLSTGLCLMVFPRHDKKVFDCDIHPAFELNSTMPCLVTCSGLFLYLWCSHHDFVVKRIAAHDEVVYKCVFNPEGSLLITCSEDHTLKLWAFPEVYLLYTFRGHEGAVCTARFSPSGRYLISGSNYKERKLLMWDASMPKINRPVQYPSIVYWSPEGLVRKLCIQKQTPPWTFWLTKQEQNKLKGVAISSWPGEMEPLLDDDSDSGDSDDVETSSASEGDSLTDPFDHPFFVGDVRYVDGARLQVLALDIAGNPTAATEYIPGGYLVLRLQSGYEPISDAFITVCIKDTQFDSFSVGSGSRLGRFKPHVLAPWMGDTEGLLLDEDAYMCLRPEAQPGVRLDMSGQALSFKNPCQYDKEGSTNEEPHSNSVEVVWECPNAFELGPAIVSVNLKLRGSNKWQSLKYSLRESPTRIIRSRPDDIDNASITSSVVRAIVNAEGEKFLFDQEALHARLLDCIRTKNWSELDSMLDEKCVLYLEEGQYRRCGRAVEALRQLFGTVHGLVSPAPMLYSAGVTRAVVVVEGSEVPADTSRLLSASLHASLTFDDAIPVVETPLDNPEAYVLGSVLEEARVGVHAVDEVELGKRNGDMEWEEPGMDSLLTGDPTGGRERGAGVRNADTQRLQTENERLHTERPTSRAANRVTVTPIAGFRTRTPLDKASQNHRYDLLTIVASTGDDSEPLHMREENNRNPFLPVGNVLIKERGFGPDIQHFMLPYPEYYPQRAGGAFTALRARLSLLEARWAEEEQRRIPALSTVRLEEEAVLKKTLATGIETELLANRFAAFLKAVKNTAYSKRRSSSPVDGLAAIMPLDLHVPRMTLLILPLLSRDSEEASSPLNNSSASFKPKGAPADVASRSFGLARDKNGNLTEPTGRRLPASATSSDFDSRRCSRDLYGRRLSYMELPGLIPISRDESQRRQHLQAAEVVDVVRSAGLLRRFRSDAGCEIAHAGAVNDAAFSPSERLVASAGGDKLVKLWDSADGSQVKTLRGHENEVMGVLFSQDEMFLVSGGADGIIFIWDLLTETVSRSLRGHSDCIYSIAALPDISIIISCSHDKTIKTWHLNPAPPSAPEPPRVVGTTETSILLCWSAPPSFNEELSAFHLQYRVGLRNPWLPEPAQSLPPHYRSKNIEGLVSNTGYYFRVSAENRMGCSAWSESSRQITTMEGLPERLDRPVISDVSAHALALFWYTPNPILFGSAARTFFIHTVHNGELQTEESEWKRVDLAEGATAGSILLETLKQRRQEDEQIASGRKLLSRAEHARSVKLSTEDFDLVLSREHNENFILMSSVIDNLLCGTPYRFFITCRNSKGDSPPSPLTRTISTQPGCPQRPLPPRITAMGLTSLSLKWDAPFDGGSAILGFRLSCSHLPHDLVLKRTRTSVELIDLLPNTVYAVTLVAYNAFGASEPSEPSSIASSSSTGVREPDRPAALKPVAGTWKTMVLEGRLPSSYNTAVTSICVERRWLKPFIRGDWEEAVEYLVPSEVKLVADDIWQEPGLDETASVTSLDAGLDQVFAGKGSKAKTFRMKQSLGERFLVTMDNLTADTIYEFRYTCISAGGASKHSFPSRRAKSNQVRVPQAFSAPMVMRIKDQAVTLRVVNPVQAPEASPMQCIHIETKDVIKKTSSYLHSTFNVAFDGKYVIEPLRPGGSFQFRVFGESAEGKGPTSQWSDIAAVPMPIITNIKTVTDNTRLETN